MLQNGKKASLSRYAAGAAAWLLSALILLAASAALAVRLRLDETQIGWLSGGIVFLASAAAGIVCRVRAAESSGRGAGMLFCLAVSACLLILGLTIDSSGMSLLSALRVLLCALLGTLIGSMIPMKRKQGRGKRRFGRGKVNIIS